MIASDIEVHDIEWLESRVPDIRDFLTRFQIVFNRGGFIAGGCLRRALERGNVESLFDAEREWHLVETLDGQEVNRYAANQVDVDFFFPNRDLQEASTHAWARKVRRHLLREKKKQLRLNRRNKINMSAFKSPQSITTQYASTYFFIKDEMKFPIQFVKIRVGTPEEVLATFDFINCKIATDGERVWVHKNLLKYEREKKLVISSGGLTTAMHRRVAKYVANGGYTSIENQELLYDWWFERLKKDSQEQGKFFDEAVCWLYENHQSGLPASYAWERVFFLHDGIVKNEEIPLFFSTDSRVLAIMLDKREESGMRRFHVVQEY
tara:strand:- start:7652 stop:8617 length:966 start_codon:yes stop_codon:yes gene_type:complete